MTVRLHMITVTFAISTSLYQKLVLLASQMSDDDYYRQ